MPIIMVPERVPLDREPLIFLAGPIQGAADWQAEAIRLLTAADPDAWITTPRSPPPWHGDAKAQYDWEHDHPLHAKAYGVILFWLANEAEHSCARAFAQTTRFEFGWFGPHHGGRHHVALGMDDHFTNGLYLRHALGRFAPGFPIQTTLEDTCSEALRLLKTPRASRRRHRPKPKE